MTLPKLLEQMRERLAARGKPHDMSLPVVSESESLTDLAFALDALEIALGALERIERIQLSEAPEDMTNIADRMRYVARAARAKIEALAKERGE